MQSNIGQQNVSMPPPQQPPIAPYPSQPLPAPQPYPPPKKSRLGMIIGVIFIVIAVVVASSLAYVFLIAPSKVGEEGETTSAPPITQIDNFSISASDITREKNQTTIYFAITKAADTNKSTSLKVTLIDDHENEYSGTLYINFCGAPSGVISQIPTGFIYVESVIINMPDDAPIKFIRFGDELKKSFEDIKFGQPSFKQDFGDASIEFGTSIGIGEYLTFTPEIPTSDVIGWRLPVAVANTEYNPSSVSVNVGVQFSDGMIVWNEKGKETEEVPGSGQVVLEPRLFTVSQGIIRGCPQIILMLATDKSTSEQAFKIASIDAAQLPSIPERIVFDDGSYDSNLYVTDMNGSNKTLLYSGSYPCSSPCGSKVVFQSSDKGIYIRLLDVDAPAATKIVDKVTDKGEKPAWSPDGTKIAFTKGSFCGGYKICTINIDGSNQTNITVFGSNPVWSPDGTKIAFSHDFNTYQGPGIYIVNADGTNLKKITEYGYGSPLAWSPDGTKIAFSTSGGWLNYYLCTINTDGSDLTKLVENSYGFYPGSWLPDGTKIVYSDYNNNFIYTIKVDSHEKTALVEGYNPTWVPAFKLGTESTV